MLTRFLLETSGKQLVFRCNFPLQAQCKHLSTTKHLSNNEQSDSYFGQRFDTEQTQLRPQYNGEWPKITLFGDSIVRISSAANNKCWGSMLRNKVADYFDVDIRGFPGYTTRDALNNMQFLFPKQYLAKVELFIEFFGTLDSWKQGIPRKEYEENNKRIIESLLQNGLSKDKLVLITAPWYEHETANMYIEQFNLGGFEKSLETARKFNETKLKVAKQFDVTCVDFFEPTVNYEPLADLFFDGIHPSKIGAELLFSKLFPVIEQKIEQNFGKPLAKLYHVEPYENRPHIREKLEIYFKTTTLTKKVNT